MRPLLFDIFGFLNFKTQIIGQKIELNLEQMVHNLRLLDYGVL